MTGALARGAGGSLRLRVLLTVLLAALTALVWTERRAALDRRSERASAEQSAERARREVERGREREERLARLAALLDRRAPGPESVAAVRARLLDLAAPRGVDLTSVRLAPLARPPRGTAGAEAQLTAEGRTEALLEFVAAVEAGGWPLRFDRAQLTEPGAAGAGRPAVLTAAASVFWPEEGMDTGAAAGGDARLDAEIEAVEIEAVSDWLEARLPAAGRELRAAAPPPRPREPALRAEPSAEREPPTPFRPAEVPRAPELHGFVDLGSGEPVQAALFYEGETVLVTAGDRVGRYRVADIEPSESVLLERPDGPPLLLTLR